jgi:hypothetical protein
MEAVIGIIGIVVAIATYYAGMRHGKQLEKERQKHEIELEKEALRGNEWVNLARSSP